MSFKGKTVKVQAKAPFYGFEDSTEYEPVHIEDLWQNVQEEGKSWMICEGNLACLGYAVRAGVGGLPIDNNVWYGKYEGLGYLIHESEIVNE